MPQISATFAVLNLLAFAAVICAILLLANMASRIHAKLQNPDIIAPAPSVPTRDRATDINVAWTLARMEDKRREMGKATMLNGKEYQSDGVAGVRAALARQQPPVRAQPVRKLRAVSAKGD